MNASDWELLEQWFDCCAEAEPTERIRLLEELARENSHVHSQVVGMLENKGFATALDQGLHQEHETDDRSVRPGSVLGPWRLEEEIGSGGMGTVFRAVPVDGTEHPAVAIKVMRQESFRDLRERFRRECQAMARMDHPNIARLFDAGITEDGVDYFVMELIDGVPIDQYCDEGKLTVDERLRLFEVTCRAVEEAHRQFVVHRDLKPSNVLVDRSGNPKLLDFGISKSIDPNGSGSFVTRTGHRPMTPQFASPEQIQSGPITAATDVFCMGVMLHQLVAGARPWKTPSGLLHELERAVCEDDPRPVGSTFWSAKNREQIAHDRSSSPTRLRRRLQGPLATVLATALARDPDDRYPSAAAFADDLRAVVERRAIAATPPPLATRLRAWVGRRRKALLGTAGLLITAGGLSLLGHQLQQQTAQTDEHAQVAKQESARRNEAEERMNVMLDQLVRSAAPWDAPGRALDTTLCDRAVTLLEIGEPAADVEVPLRETIARCYSGIGEWEQAKHHLRVAQERALELGPDHPASVAVEVERIDLLWKLGQLAEASEAAASLPDPSGHSELSTPLKARIQRIRALVHRVQGNWAEAAELCWQAEQWTIESGENLPLLLAKLRGDRAILLTEGRRFAEAEALNRLAIREAKGLESDPRVVQLRVNLAAVLLFQKKVEPALEAATQALEELSAFIGSDHHLLIQARHVIALCYRELGRLEDAEHILGEAMTIASRHELSAEHPDQLQLQMTLASIQDATGHWEKSKETWTRVLEGVALTYGEGSVRFAALSVTYADALTNHNEFRQAHKVVTPALEVLRTEVGDEDLVTADAHYTLGRIAWSTGQVDDAEHHHHQALAARELLLDWGHWDLSTSLYNAALPLVYKRDYEEAIDLLSEALEMLQECDPNNKSYQARAAVLLADCHRNIGNLDDAEANLDWIVDTIGIPPDGTIEASIYHASRRSLERAAALASVGAIDRP